MAAEIIGGAYNGDLMLGVVKVLIQHVSLLTLAVLAVVFVASVWVFGELVRRETSHRRLALLSQWARSRGLRLDDSDDAPRAADFLAPLAAFNPSIDLLIHGPSIAIVQVRTENPTAASAPTATAPRWHLLLRRLDHQWPMTALRPTAHTFSIVDLFGMSSYPSLGSTERFVVFGAAAESALALSDSAIPALLPPDVGLLLAGSFLILDFTTRPFDQIEFGRMIDLAEQLAPRLARK
jgi:hypothetical protein